MRRIRSKACFLSGLLLSLFLVFAPRPLQGMTVLGLSLEQMTQLASQIFTGEVTGAEEEWDREGRAVVVVTVAVYEVLKGEVGPRVSFRQLREAPEEHLSKGETRGLIHDLPTYEKGEQVVLFMSRPGPQGLTAPIGILQGKFRIVTDGEGHRTVANIFENKNLFRNLAKESPKGFKSLSRSEKKLVGKASPGPVAYEDFVSLVRKMTP